MGQIVPMTRAPPSSVETGCSSPANWMVGRMVRIAVMNTAATWVLVNVEVTMPTPVVTMT